MKKIKYLLLIIMTMLVLPFTVFAEGEEEVDAISEDSASKEVIIYFFRGEGCSHCAETEEWFQSIEEEMGEKYIIKDYETWYNEENAELMTKVAKTRGEEELATGVPYIIIGDKSWVGFTDEYKDQIIEKINEMYEQDVSQRYDVMTFVNNSESDDKTEKSSSDILALIIIALVAGGAVAGIIFARKQNV